MGGYYVKFFGFYRKNGAAFSAAPSYYRFLANELFAVKPARKFRTESFGLGGGIGYKFGHFISTSLPASADA